MAEVKLQGLSKRFGATCVLDDLTVTIRDGELFTIVGPSGCGKSTLLHLLAGLDRPTSGSILFDDLDVTALEPRDRDVALVFQSYALYPHMTVRDNLAFPLRVAGRKAGFDRRRIEDEVARVAGLLELETLLGRWPRELSGGQRQRVALGRALIRRPRLFLLDEPLSNLDAQLRTVMRAELRRLHDHLGTTMVYVTHDQTEAMTLADRVAVLDRGRLQQVGAPQDLYDRPGNLFVAEFIGYPRMNVLDAVVRNGRLRSGALAFPSSGLAGRLGEGNRVKLGIRPEHIRVLSKDEASTGSSAEVRWIDGMVRLIEHTGGQIWATIEIKDSGDCSTLVGSISAGCSVRLGERAFVAVTEDFLQFFDAATGRALRAG